MIMGVAEVSMWPCTSYKHGYRSTAYKQTSCAHTPLVYNVKSVLTIISDLRYCACDIACTCILYLVRLYRLEASAEVLKPIPLLVHLHSLSIVLDLGIHTVRTFLDCCSNSTTSLCLWSNNRQTLWWISLSLSPSIPLHYRNLQLRARWR